MEQKQWNLQWKENSNNSSYKNGKLDYATLEDVVGQNKEIGAVSGNTPTSNIRKIKMDDDLVKTARDIGICLGD